MGSLKTQISKKIQKPKYMAKKKKKLRQRFGRGTFNTCAKVQGLSLKNGVDIGLSRNLGHRTLKEFRTSDSQGIWGYMLEPAPRPVISSGHINTRGNRYLVQLMSLFLPLDVPFGLLLLRMSTKCIAVYLVLRSTYVYTRYQVFKCQWIEAQGPMSG